MEGSRQCRCLTAIHTSTPPPVAVQQLYTKLTGYQDWRLKTLLGANSPNRRSAFWKLSLINVHELPFPPHTPHTSSLAAEPRHPSQPTFYRDEMNASTSESVKYHAKYWQGRVTMHDNVDICLHVFAYSIWFPPSILFTIYLLHQEKITEAHQCICTYVRNNTCTTYDMLWQVLQAVGICQHTSTYVSR